MDGQWKPLATIIVGAVLVAAIVLWLFRFELTVAGPNGAIAWRLDRWTGDVSYCLPSGGDKGRCVTLRPD